MNASNQNVFVTVTQDILDQLALLKPEDIRECIIENASMKGLIKAWYPITLITKDNRCVRTKLGQKMIENLPVLHPYLPEVGYLKRRIFKTKPTDEDEQHQLELGH
jgi:hypothetical protein